MKASMHQSHYKQLVGFNPHPTMKLDESPFYKKGKSNETCFNPHPTMKLNERLLVIATTPR
jgi:hypothetical protein